MRGSFHEAFAETAAVFDAAVEGARDEPLAAIGRAYRRWALDHPHLYRLMTDGPLDRDALPEGVEAASAAPLVRACSGDGDLARAAWAFAHGMTILELDGRFPPGADLDAAWRRGARLHVDPARPATRWVVRLDDRGDVGDDGAGGRQAPGAHAGHDEFARMAGVDADGVVDASRDRHRMVPVQQRGVDAQFQSFIAPDGHGEQLQRVAEASGVFDVPPVHARDALTGDVLEADAHAEREPHQHGQLVGERPVRELQAARVDEREKGGDPAAAGGGLGQRGGL